MEDIQIQNKFRDFNEDRDSAAETIRPISESVENLGTNPELKKEGINPDIDLKHFTKRYAPMLRNELAHRLRGLRHETREKKAVKEIDDQKRQTEISERLLENAEQARIIQAEIQLAEQTVQEEKNSLWGRIIDLIKTRDLETELGLTELRKHQEENEAERAKQEGLMEEFMNVSLSTEVLDEARGELDAFYSEMSDRKDKFESETEARNIESISSKNRVLFVHMIGNNGYGGHDRTNKISFAHGFDLISTVNPTLSTSTIREGDMRVFPANTIDFNAGIIIGKGRLLTTAGQLIPKGFFSRRLNNSDGVNFESDISETLPKAINKEGSGYARDYTGYNELSVENTEPKAILLEDRGQVEVPLLVQEEIMTTYDLRSKRKVINDRLTLKNYEEVLDCSAETGMPIIVKKDEKLYRDCFRGFTYHFYTGELDEDFNPVSRRISKDEATQLDQSKIVVSLEYDFSNEITIEEVNDLPTPVIPDSEKVDTVHSLIKSGKIDPLSLEGKQLIDTFVSLGGNREALSKPSFTREELDTILSRANHTPEDIIGILEKDFGHLLDMPAGVWEGYTLREHTLMVLNQYQKYYQGNTIPNGELLLALHDIGKPLAVMHSSKDKQHKYTLNIAKPALSSLGFSSQEVSFGEALINNDLLGEFLQYQIGTEQVAKEIIGLANASGMTPDVFLNHLLSYYMSDAGSYTEDAGGKKSLDDYFIFDKEKSKMSLIPALEEKIQELKRTIKDIAEKKSKESVISQ